MPESKQDRLIRVMRAHSKGDGDDDFFKMLDEQWEMVDISIFSACNGVCVCNNNTCKWIFLMQRKDGVTFKEYPAGLPIGSSCMKHFSPYLRKLSHYLCKLVELRDERMEVAINKNFENYSFLDKNRSLCQWIIICWAKHYEQKKFRLPVDYARLKMKKINTIDI